MQERDDGDQQIGNGFHGGLRKVSAKAYFTRFEANRATSSRSPPAGSRQ